MNATDITRAVCKELSSKELTIRPKDLIDITRLREKVLARQLTFYLCRVMLRWSHRQIGEKFCRDHTTVGFGIRQIKRDLKRDVFLKARVQKIIKKVTA